MKASEYINAMQALIDEHGDLEVETFRVDGDRVEASAPKIAFRKILSKRERKPEFWNDYLRDSGEKKGEKVIRV